MWMNGIVLGSSSRLVSIFVPFHLSIRRRRRCRCGSTERYDVCTTINTTYEKEVEIVREKDS